MQITYLNVIECLLEATPDFLRYKENRLEDYEDPRQHDQHMVFGAYTRFLIDEFRNKRAGEESAFQAGLDFMELAIQSHDAQARNLVIVSFLENLHLAGADYSAIKARLGKSLREGLRRIEKDPE